MPKEQQQTPEVSAFAIDEDETLLKLPKNDAEAAVEGDGVARELFAAEVNAKTDTTDEEEEKKEEIVGKDEEVEEEEGKSEADFQCMDQHYQGLYDNLAGSGSDSSETDS